MDRKEKEMDEGRIGFKYSISLLATRQDRAPPNKEEKREREKEREIKSVGVTLFPVCTTSTFLTVK